MDEKATTTRATRLHVRLAKDSADVLATQRLRHHVFYDEMGAIADATTRTTKLDQDRFDAVCDHLMVVRTEGTDGTVLVGDGELVGTYRLLRQDVASNHFGFYTQAEFDIAPLLARKPDLRFLELGRSCVLKQHRSKPVVELLWQGIWDYVRHHQMDVMLGCASLEGTDPDYHAETLSFLAYHAAPAPEWAVRAQAKRLVDMKRLAISAIDAKRALARLPPLIKGYLRLGCSIGEGAVIDQQFNTIDVLIILPVSQINPRYFERFGQPSD
jgi:L-ornithine Nalpha-acyltransferase